MERPSQFCLAAADFAAGMKLWRLWTRLAWNDVLHRYRRSSLGPFWSTINIAITVAALGAVYSQIFHLPVRQLMPFVCAGLIVWGFISATLLEAGYLFSGSESFIKQVRLPYSLYVFRFVFGKFILLLHDFPIYLAVMLYFRISPGIAALYVIPGVALLLLNSVFASLAIGLMSARFRDVPRILTSLVQLLFLVTPIIWMPDLLGPHQFVTKANPFFHVIEIVRAPLLGSAPSTATVNFLLALTLVNVSAATALFLRYRARIAYWV